MDNSTIPLYLDWSFWAVIVAGIAVILSQLPPVHLLFKRARLDLELFSRIHITHKVGNPNIQIHLILTNVGGKTVRVKEGTITVKRDGKSVATLSAQSYLPDPNDKATVLFTPFYIEPKEEWAHIVNFLNYFSRSDEKKYKGAESLLKQNILSRRDLPENKDKLVQADDKFVSVFHEMFKENFIWFPGEYEVIVSIETIPKRAKIEKAYRFMLFESDSQELEKYKDDYKFGGGIWWDSERNQGILLQLSER